MFADEEVDRRIRDGLIRSADGVELNALVLLREATGRGNRALRRRRQAFVLACVTVVLAVAALAMLPLTLGRHTGVQQAETPRASRLAGSFSRTVPQESGVVRTGHLAGRWTLQFSEHGTARVQAPSAFEGIQSGVSFREQGHHMRIDVFAQDFCAGEPVGSYLWISGGDAVRFTNVDDTCPARIRFLTGGSWQRVP